MDLDPKQLIDYYYKNKENISTSNQITKVLKSVSFLKLLSLKVGNKHRSTSSYMLLGEDMPVDGTFVWNIY